MILALFAVVGALIALAALYFLGRSDSDRSPHSSLGPISSVLLSGFAALTWFLVAAGWAAEDAENLTMPPDSLYVADILLGCAVLVYPALAFLPYNRRNALMIALFGAVVGYSVALARVLGAG